MNPKVSRTMFLICFAWVFALCLCAPAGTVLATEPDPSKTVDSIEVLQMPSQTVYVIGESFSAEGGVLQINYTDGTTGEIAMTDSSVKLSSPTMNTANTKNVTATYEKKRAVFKIEVAAGMCSVTFDLQYDGAPGNRVLSISKGMTAQPPELSARDGYEFVDWYANPDYTKVYDFETPVTGDITVYALWKKADTEYVQVTFDYDYYGVQLDRYSYPVEMGAVVSKPVADPVRVGYSFEKWVDEMGADFDFAQEITTDTTVLAQWQKAAGDVQTWIFEAEDTDLTGKIGPSYSGSAQEESMIIYNEAVEASGNRMVGYLYEQGISLEFYIASDEEVDDAQITVRIDRKSVV